MRKTYGINKIACKIYLKILGIINNGFKVIG